jgi:lipopolysaccharide export system protein LptA
MKNIFAALSAVFIAVCGISEADEVRVTGKTMNMMPSRDTMIFAGDAVVEHSSFTLKADRIVTRDAHSEIEAAGNVVAVSKESFDELRGDEGLYSSKTGRGLLRGNPASLVSISTEGKKSELTAPLVEWSTGSVTARGESLLRQNDMELKSEFMDYDREGGIFTAYPVNRLFIKEKGHILTFSAQKMIYSDETESVRLEGKVKGRILAAKQTQAGGSK